jgi:hypothetical protein
VGPARRRDDLVDVRLQDAAASSPTPARFPPGGRAATLEAAITDLRSRTERAERELDRGPRQDGQRLTGEGRGGRDIAAGDAAAQIVRKRGKPVSEKLTPETARDGSCPSVYPECPPGDQRCVRADDHRRPGALHCNRAGFAWTDEEAAASATRIRIATEQQLADAAAEAREALTRYDEAPQTSIVPCCEHAEELAGALRDLLDVADSQGADAITCSIVSRP